MGRDMVMAAAASMLAACGAEPAAPPAPAETASAERPSPKEAERYIRRSAEEWAAVGVTGDPAPLARILADDYVGVASTGEVRDKVRQLKPIEGPPPFTASRVDYVDFRHIGDTIIAQGAETLKRRDGRPDLRLIWTDVWMFRDGKWQVAASQDSVRPPGT